MKRPRIRKTQWSKVEAGDVAELVRDVQAALDTVPEQKIFVVGPQQYSEPMYFAIEDERPPRIVTLSRVVNADSPATTVTYGSVCWEYAGVSGGQIKVHDIVNMSTGATRYAFTWKVEW